MNINFNNMSIDELNKLIANANAEIKQRTENKKIELLNNIIKALKAFEKDFPFDTLYEEEGDYASIDATDVLRKIENFNDFT